MAIKKLCLPKEYIVSTKCGKPSFSLTKWLNTKPKDRCTELEKFKFDCKNPIKVSPCDCKDDCDTFSFNDWLTAYREDSTSVDPIYFPESWFVDANCSKNCCSFLINPCDNLTEEIRLPKKHFKKDCCSISFISQCIVPIIEDNALKCTIGLEIVIRYSNTEGQCPGGHVCNRADFVLNLNGVSIGDINLNNGGDPPSPGTDLFGNSDIGGDRLGGTFIITPAQASAIASQPPFPNLTLTLTPAAWNVNPHTNVSWVHVRSSEGVDLYDGCPTNNIITFNPCTGEVV